MKEKTVRHSFIYSSKSRWYFYRYDHEKRQKATRKNSNKIKAKNQRRTKNRRNNNNHRIVRNLLFCAIRGVHVCARLSLYSVFKRRYCAMWWRWTLVDENMYTRTMENNEKKPVNRRALTEKPLREKPTSIIHFCAVFNATCTEYASKWRQ